MAARKISQFKLGHYHSASLLAPRGRSLLCSMMRFRTYKNTDLSVSEIASFVAALGACLSGGEAAVAFSIAT
jgi:hypothetical protein